jgi:regulator of protease activity HflC (stomatin/prohibitin superfamily)
MGPCARIRLMGIAVVIVIVVVVFVLMASIRVVNEYERCVIFRLGRVRDGAKGPGLFLIVPLIDKLVKISLQTVTMDIPPQELITRDNVGVRVHAVVYFSVVDPVRAVVKVQNYGFATAQVSQATLRSIIGQVSLDELLQQQEEVNHKLETLADHRTEPWGVKVSLVELKDIELPDTMKRAMAREAESERERRAKIISAQGELEASSALSQAAGALEAHPAAMQLRTLSTLVEVAAEKNSTLVFPVPFEVLQLMQAVTARMTADLPSETKPTQPF